MEFTEIDVTIELVDEASLFQAATIHSISWKESHRSFCSLDFIEMHTPDRQRKYLSSKMNGGTKLYMIVDEEPVGIVSVTNNLIEDLYVLPDKQNLGYGTLLLQFAISQCVGIPTLWILENNVEAERLYRRMGFEKTGRKNTITKGLDEIEFALTYSTRYRSECMEGHLKPDWAGRQVNQSESVCVAFLDQTQ